MTSVEAIKKYFNMEPNAKPVSIQELKELSQDERSELGKMCAAALGAEWTPPATAMSTPA